MAPFHRAASDGQTFLPGGGVIQLSLPVLQVTGQPVQRMLHAGSGIRVTTLATPPASIRFACALTQAWVDSGSPGVRADAPSCKCSSR